MFSKYTSAKRQTVLLRILQSIEPEASWERGRPSGGNSGCVEFRCLDKDRKLAAEWWPMTVDWFSLIRKTNSNVGDVEVKFLQHWWEIHSKQIWSVCQIKLRREGGRRDSFWRPRNPAVPNPGPFCTCQWSKPVDAPSHICLFRQLHEAELGFFHAWQRVTAGVSTPCFCI